MEKLLSPKELATAIGVSESSLKRWVDEGRVQATRTAGGHRRIPFRQALQFIRQSGVEVVQPELLGLPDLSVAAEGDDTAGDAFMVRALVAGERVPARAWLIARYLAGDSIGRIFDGPIAEALRQVGEEWKHGPAGIHVEHRTTDACLFALNALRGLLPAPAAEAPLAIGCSPEGDPYQIPSLMAAVVLGAEGWRDINLGANLPLEALLSAIRSYRPALVWISLSAEGAVGEAVRILPAVALAAREVDAEIVIGGRVFAGGLSDEWRSLHYLAGMEALATYGRGLLAQDQGT